MLTNKQLEKFANSINIAEELDEERLREIADEVCEGLSDDEDSMTDWLSDAHKAMELTDLKREPKNFPFKGASNTKYPLTTLAVVQFSSRVLPELIKNGEIVKYRIIGPDPQGIKERRGNRVKTHMNHQILEQMTDWLDQRDRLVNQVAVVGTCYVKTWYDPILEQNRSEVMSYDLIKVHDSIESLDKAPRISQYMYMTKNDLIEHIRYGLYRDIEFNKLKENAASEKNDSYELVEQHCWLNLLKMEGAESNDSQKEDDGYRQPYIVTIHKHSKEILRIVARYTVDDIKYNARGKIKCIKPQHYFSDYHFIPNPRNRFHSIGFGTLLLDMNLMTNSVLNQIINCGTLSMTRGGVYLKDVGLRPDDFIIEPGDWIPAENPIGSSLKDSFMPFDYAPPSPVLFNLLETLLKAGKELTSSTEALTGMQDGTNVSPNTLFAIIQQGLKVFTAIQRRIFRGFKKELEKLVKLNAMYLDYREYLRIIDVPQQELAEIFDPQTGEFIDYKDLDIDITPVADLTVSSEAERMARVNAGFQAAVQAQQVFPGVINPQALMLDLFKSLAYPNPEAMINPPAQPQPSPEMIKLQSDVDLRGKELELKQADLQIKAKEMEARVQESRARSIKHIADAEAVDKTLNVQSYGKVLDSQLRNKELDIRSKEVENANAKAKPTNPA